MKINKNKILIFLSVFIITFSIFIPNSFADSTSMTITVKDISTSNYFDFDDFTFQLSSEFSKYHNLVMYFFKTSSGSTCDIYISDLPFEHRIVNNSPGFYSKGHIYNLEIKSSNINTIIQTLKNNSYTLSDFKDLGTINTYIFSVGSKFICSSTCDVYDVDGNVVFPASPLGVTLMGITKVGELPVAMVEVLKILIPVGLILCGIGLVIYLTRLVISRLQ